MRHKYSKIEDKFLIDNVKGITLKELTHRFNNKFNLNLTESAISARKTKLRIKSGIVGGQFIKGDTPFNKGKKWIEYMSEESQKNSRKTTFKKGSIPPNHKPIGSERITKRGIMIKIKDGQKSKNWTYKSRYIYEQVYGQIPKSHKIIFADRDHTNIDLNNLILVSSQEQLIMNRHKLIKKDAELTKTGRNIAKLINEINLKRKINRR